MSGFAFSQSVSNDSTCVGITSKGLSCKIKVNVDSTSLCHLHNPNYIKKIDTTISVICSGTTGGGNACKNKTKDSSGLCHHHRN